MHTVSQKLNVKTRSLRNDTRCGQLRLQQMTSSHYEKNIKRLWLVKRSSVFNVVQGGFYSLDEMIKRQPKGSVRPVEENSAKIKPATMRKATYPYLGSDYRGAIKKRSMRIKQFTNNRRILEDPRAIVYLRHGRWI